MALCSSLSLISPIVTSQHKLTSKSFSSSIQPNFHGIFTKTNNSTKFILNAGFNVIEPDLNEDPRDQFAASGIEPVYFYTANLLLTFYVFFHVCDGVCLFCLNFRKILSMEYLMDTILSMKVKKIKVVY